MGRPRHLLLQVDGRVFQQAGGLLRAHWNGQGVRDLLRGRGLPGHRAAGYRGARQGRAVPVLERRAVDPAPRGTLEGLTGAVRRALITACVIKSPPEDLMVTHARKYALVPRDVPRVQTAHRRICTSLPVPESVPIFEKL